MDAEIDKLVARAAIKWCGQKDRETFPEDGIYFKMNWNALPGLRQFVLIEAATTITRLTAERDEARARAERAEREKAGVDQLAIYHSERAQVYLAALERIAVLAHLGAHAPALVEVARAALTQEATDGQS